MEIEFLVQLPLANKTTERGAITNNDVGVAGIAQVDIALLDHAHGAFVSSLTWAMNNNIRVVNASFRYTTGSTINGTPEPAPATVAHANAIRTFGNSGGILIASAGNQGQNQYANTDVTPQFPAGYGDVRNFPDITNVIAVGSIDSNGARSSFSNYGQNSIHLFAPGGNILSTYPTERCDAGNCTSGTSSTHHSRGYHYWKGTSFAAPMVAGVAALILSAYPNLNATQLKFAIMNGVDKMQTLDDLCVSGGRLNAYGAIESVLSLPAGAGTLADPFLISTLDHLQLIRIAPSSCYRLAVSNLNLNGINWEPISSFSGIFDGNNNTISNLSIYDKSVAEIGDWVGLFAINFGTIKNLTLSDVNITFATDHTLPTLYCGALAGKNLGAITNVTVSGNLVVNRQHAVLGGLTGENRGYISHCKAGLPNISNSLYLKGNASIGGIAGESTSLGNTTAIIQYSQVYNAIIDYFWVASNGYIGGIVGKTETSTLNMVHTMYSQINYVNPSSSDSRSPYMGMIVGCLAYYSNLSDVGIEVVFNNYSSRTTSINPGTLTQNQRKNFGKSLSHFGSWPWGGNITETNKLHSWNFTGPWS